MPAAQAVVSLANVDYYFGAGALRTQVLFGVSAEIVAGELVMIMGPSGSGKTTLLNLVSALRRVPAGSLRVLGSELNGAADSALQALRRRIGFIFQQHHLLNSLTVRQNVRMGILGDAPAGEARRRADAMLAEVGLSGRENACPKQLSVGQRQRVAVARALVREPDLLLADEPTASLDGQTGREIMELLRRLARRRGCAVLIVTHDSRILDVADRMMYLEDGRLSSFASVTSPHAAHLLTALRPLAQGGAVAQVLGRANEAEFLDMMRTLGAEAEQFLNALDLGPPPEAARTVAAVSAAVLDRMRDLLRVKKARIWRRSEDAPAAALESMRSGRAIHADDSLFYPLANREYDMAAAVEISGDTGPESERTCRDFARPLGVLTQLRTRLEQYGQ